MSTQDASIPIPAISKRPRSFVFFKRFRKFIIFLSLSSFISFALWAGRNHFQIVPFPSKYLSDDVVFAYPDVNSSQGSSSPLTSLGLEADQAYKLGSVIPSQYHVSLESFINTSIPSSLRSKLKGQLDMYISRNFTGPLPERPRIIWQTNDVYKTNRDTKSWKFRNPGYDFRFLKDEDADEWVRNNFEGSDIQWTWDNLPHIVMKADFLRYLLLLLEGGVYSDIDTMCVKPISVWGKSPDVVGAIREEGPSVIIGVEADVGEREDWHKWWARPIQLVQWTMAFPSGHPIMLDTIRRIHEQTLEGTRKFGNSLQAIPEEERTRVVLEWTGPAVFTDSVMRFLKTDSGTDWPKLKNLLKPLRIGSVTILPVTGFSPGVGNFGAGGIHHPQAMVHHRFNGSWKPGAKSVDIV